jgi:hypothetical protein
MPLQIARIVRLQWHGLYETGSNSSKSFPKNFKSRLSSGSPPAGGDGKKLLNKQVVLGGERADAQGGLG